MFPVLRAQCPNPNSVIYDLASIAGAVKWVSRCAGLTTSNMPEEQFHRLILLVREASQKLCLVVSFDEAALRETCGTFLGQMAQHCSLKTVRHTLPRKMLDNVLFCYVLVRINANAAVVRYVVDNSTVDADILRNALILAGRLPRGDSADSFGPDQVLLAQYAAIYHRMAVTSQNTQTIRPAYVETRRYVLARYLASGGEADATLGVMSLILDDEAGADTLLDSVLANQKIVGSASPMMITLLQLRGKLGQYVSACDPDELPHVIARLIGSGSALPIIRESISAGADVPVALYSAALILED